MPEKNGVGAADGQALDMLHIANRARRGCDTRDLKALRIQARRNRKGLNHNSNFDDARSQLTASKLRANHIG